MSQNQISELSREEMGQIQEENKRLKLIQYLVTSMSGMNDPRDILNTMLKKCIQLTGADTGSIMLKDQKDSQLYFEIYEGFDNEIVEKTKIELGVGITGSVAQDGIPRLINDVNRDPVYIALRKDIRSELAVPLNHRGEIFGVLSVDSVKKNAFREEDKELLQTVSIQASQAWHQGRIYQELKRKIHFDTVLIDIAQSIENIQELQDSFDVVMKKLAEGLEITRGMMILFENQSHDQLSMISGYNISEEEISRANYRVGEGVIGKVVETGEPAVIRNVLEEASFLNKMKIKRDRSQMFSFVAVPIKIDGIIGGVLAMEKLYEDDRELDEEKQLLIFISNIISNKVQNYQRLMDEKKSLMKENSDLRKELYQRYGINNLIGKSSKMLELFELIQLVADSTSSVLIRGESGTGKELVAKALHFNSSRKNGPFISINCASIPENLLESELFGYKKGAFTGATSDRKGKFVQANGGTIFLDEIGDMPMYLQAKLLRVLQEREVEPIGDSRKISIDIRVVSATNKPVLKMIKNNSFREDLYYRLNVVELLIPPLKDRKEDIPLLATHFIKKYSERNRKDIRDISPEVLRLLQSHLWPGNVRELENAIERAVLLTRGHTLEVNHLPSSLVSTEEVSELQVSKWIDGMMKNQGYEGNMYSQIVSLIEKEVVTKALLVNNKNKVKTSRFLGINRNTLRSKMKEYHINL